MDIYWKLVQNKVRNMRTAYRKIKQQQLNQTEDNAKLRKSKF